MIERIRKEYEDSVKQNGWIGDYPEEDIGFLLAEIDQLRYELRIEKIAYVDVSEHLARCQNGEWPYEKNIDGMALD